MTRTLSELLHTKRGAFTNAAYSVGARQRTSEH